MMELNPNHPVTSKVREEWHKIAALLVYRTGQKRVVLPPELIDRLSREPGGVNITIKFTDGIGVELELVSDAEARRLAEKEGGLPA